MQHRGLEPTHAGAGGAMLLSAGAVGLWLLDNWMPADIVRILIVAAFGYMTIVGIWLPGRYRFVPVLSLCVVLLLVTAVGFGPTLTGRWYLIHPDALETYPHVAWLGLVLLGPLVALAITWRHHHRFDRAPKSYHWIALVMALGLTVLLAGTMPSARSPTVVGVIRSHEAVSGGTEYVLSSGATVLVDHRESRSLTGRGGERELLLVGAHDGMRWHAILVEDEWGRLGGRTVRCFALFSHGIDQGSTILFDVGLVLPKAEEFQAGTYPRNGRYESGDARSGTTPFCVDTEGRVTAYLGA